MYGFRRFLPYKRTVVVVKLLKKLDQKCGRNGSFRTQHTKCKILNTLYSECIATQSGCKLIMSIPGIGSERLVLYYTAQYN